MNKIDLIIENIEYAKLVTEQAHKDELLDEALAAARELRALKPVGWVTTEQFASTANNVTRVTLHQDRNGIPLYALEDTK
jgi:hypothetical protein